MSKHGNLKEVILKCLVGDQEKGTINSPVLLDNYQRSRYLTELVSLPLAQNLLHSRRNTGEL